MSISLREKMIRLSLFCIVIAFFFGCDLKAPTDSNKNQSEGWQEINSGLENKTIQTLALGSSNVVYAGTLNGVYKTMDGGQNWQEANKGLTSGDIKAIVVHPKETQILYCGAWGDGVFRSNDEGSSWIPLSKLNIDPRIHDIAVDETNPDNVWIATNEGLYRSQNGGQNWVRTYHSGNVLSVAFKPNDAETVYIGVRYQGTMKSKNGGESWLKINAGLFKSGALYASPNSFAFDPQNNDHVFASTGWVDIYATINGGETWSKIGPEVEGKNVKALVIHPVDAMKMWAATESHGVWHSVDGGQSWSEFNNGLKALNTSCIVIGKNGVMVVGTTGKGVFKYADAE